MTTPVIAHEERVFLDIETTFGTPEIPASTGAIEVMEGLDMGPAEQPNTRAVKDKTASRDMTLDFVSGRVDPIPFTVPVSVKSRAAADTVPVESALLKAAGLKETVNSSTSVVYSIVGAPTVTGLSILRALGPAGACYFAEHGRGGVVKQLTFEGGDQELVMRAAGAFIGKYHLGAADVTLDDESDTSMAVDTAAEVYRMGLGWYKVEDEVVKGTAIDYSTGIVTVTRAEASTTAAAHASKTAEPYIPSFAPTGSPITEANLTISLDGANERCTKFTLDITTGVDHLPGESGSEYVQGLKVVRIDATLTVEMVLTKENVAFIGKCSENKDPVAITITCGTGTGGKVAFSMPYCQVVPFAVPAPANDVSIVSMQFRVRGNSGNDSLTITYT